MQTVSILSSMPKLPDWRLEQSLNPLTIIAQSAGYSRWSDLVDSVRGGLCVTVDAPDLGGRSIGNAYLFRDACNAENITVSDIMVGVDGKDRLTLEILPN